MYVYNIIDEAKAIVAKCDLPTVYRRITDAVSLANNQGQFDASIGEMDICVCDGCVTLPADVGTVLAVNVGGQPTLIRDQWFQYHINGSGSSGWTPWRITDELGRVSTFKDPSEPVRIVAEVESPNDSNVSIRVFGWDEDGKRIYTEGSGGVLSDGFLVPTTYGYALPNPDAPLVARIDRVEKPVTNGFIRLLAISSTTMDSHTMIGYYLPWETNPSYRRIRVQDTQWIRIKYKKNDLEIRSSNDWINIENRQALLLLIKSVKFRLDNNFDQAAAAEREGMRLLSNEAEAKTPKGMKAPQIMFSEFPAENYDRLFY